MCNDLSKKQEPKAPDNNESEAIKFISRLYTHFLIYDLTFIFGGMIIVTTLLYLFYGDLDSVAQKVFVGAADGGKDGGRPYLVVLYLFGSYFIGMLVYDFVDNISIPLLNLLKKEKGIERLEWTTYTMYLKDKAKHLVLRIERTMHYEVVSTMLASACLLSAVLLKLLPWLEWSAKGIDKLTAHRAAILLLIAGGMAAMNFFNSLIYHTWLAKEVCEPLTQDDDPDEDRRRLCRTGILAIILFVVAAAFFTAPCTK